MKKMVVLFLCALMLVLSVAGCSNLNRVEGMWVEYGDDGDLDWSLEIMGTDASYKHHFEGRVIGSEDFEVIEKDDGIWLTTYSYGLPVYKFRIEVSGDKLTLYFNSGSVCSIMKRY